MNKTVNKKVNTKNWDYKMKEAFKKSRMVSKVPEREHWLIEKIRGYGCRKKQEVRTSG